MGSLRSVAARVGLTSHRSDLVSLPQNLRDCPVINEIIDGEARVALEEYQDRVLCDPSECEAKK